LTGIPQAFTSCSYHFDLSINYVYQHSYFEAVSLSFNHRRIHEKYIEVISMKYKPATVVVALSILTLLGSACFDFNASELFSEPQYKIAVGTNAVECTGVAQEVADAYESYEPSDLSDDEWCASMKDNCAEMRDLCNEAREIEPPESMTENHEKYMEALEHFEAGIDLLEAGIDEGDEAKIAESEEEMQAGAEVMEEFYQMMDEPWVEDLRDEYLDAQEE
jgi:hypothetical protein